MSEEQQRFRRRLQHLSRKHRAMGNGYSAELRRDGLLEVRPKRASRKVGLPLRSMGLAVVAVLAFKAFLMISLGAAEYQARLEGLALGSSVERAGAWIMTPDPVSVAAVDLIGAVAR